MITISYYQMLVLISAIWILVRGISWFRAKAVDWRREAQLLLVYICIVVVVRFTFCPFGKVNGQVQPLLFDASQILPFWLNLTPFVYLFDYPNMKDALVVPDAACVTDGRIITGTSAGTAVPFALALIEALRGADAAKAIADQIVIR